MNRKLNEVIYIQNNADGTIVELLPLEVEVVYNERRKMDEYVVKIGLVDDKKNYTFLRKEVAMRQHLSSLPEHETDALPVTPNPFYRDIIPNYYKSKEQLEAERAKERTVNLGKPFLNQDMVDGLGIAGIPNKEDDGSEPISISSYTPGI